MSRTRHNQAPAVLDDLRADGSWVSSSRATAGVGSALTIALLATFLASTATRAEITESERALLGRSSDAPTVRGPVTAVARESELDGQAALLNNRGFALPAAPARQSAETSILDGARALLNKAPGQHGSGVAAPSTSSHGARRRR